MSQPDQPGRGAPQMSGGVAALLPPVWVGVTMVLALHGIYSAWPATYEFDLPDSALHLVYAGLTADAINILWGLALIGLAISGSTRFPRHFTIWQLVNIVWIVAREAYVLVTPDFIVTLPPLLYAAGEIAIGVICILLLRRRPDVVTAYANPGADRPPVVVSVIAGLLGLVIGGALGFGIGLGLGIVIAETTDMSCFEGACGFFAFFLGLGGALVGALACCVLAVLWVNRRRPAPAV